MKPAVIFDFDGVVIRSREVQVYALRKCYDNLFQGCVEPDYETFFLHSGDSLANIFKIMQLPVEAIELYQNYSNEMSGNIKVHAGIRKVLKQLRKSGYKCGLCTGKDRQRTYDILNRKNLLQYFDTVVCSDDVKEAKPAPDSLILAIHNLNADKNKSVMVGDGVNDILCAKAAGIACVAVGWGDIEIDRLRKLKPDSTAYEISGLSSAIRQALQNHTLKCTYLLNDFVIQEDSCNLKCQYCLTKTSTLKKKEEDKTKKNLIYEEGTVLKNNLDIIMERLHTKSNVGILKISGGEIFLVKGILSFIREQSKQHTAVQILTNGTLLTEDILGELKKLGNISIQLSLDHHTLEGNAYRCSSSKTQAAVLTSIKKITEYGIPLEINCVLTDKNTGLIQSFAHYLMQYQDNNVMLLPFPVRGKESRNYFPRQEQYSAILELLENYEKYRKVLPPQIYLAELFHYLVKNKRSIPCHVPEAALGTFDDGRVTPCPNYWFMNLGNLTDNDTSHVFDNLRYHKIYKIIHSSVEKIKECKECFTPWDLLNLYLEGRMTYGEIIKVPLYSIPGVGEYLKTIKEKGDTYDQLIQ